MTSKKQTSWPVPLGKRDIGLGEAVREYARSTEAVPDEAVAYAGVLKRMAGRPRRVPWLVAGFGMGAVAVATVALLVLHQSSARPVPQVASPQVLPKVAPPTLPVQPLPTRAPSIPSIRLAASASVLPAGKVELIDEASAMVSADAVVRGRSQAGHTELVLDQGSIELQVVPRSPGHDFAVSAGGYRFMVVGTAFTVAQTKARLELTVSEGKVAVWRGSDRLTTVGAGGQWAVSLGTAASSHPRATRPAAEPGLAMAFRDPGRAAEPATPAPLPGAGLPGKTPPAPAALAPAPPPESPPQPAATPTQDCGGLAGRHPQEAMGCYQQQAAQGGLAGEAAQYEIARLWRDTFKEPARALAAFREQRTRFPGGVLAIEADLSIIELLPRLDRHAEALSESEHFLKNHPGGERRGEIHLLRGNIYREALRDLDHAEREYAQGATSRGRTGDESRFLRAVCLESLGRTQEARAAYELVLSQPKTTHAAEAKKRLERLAP
jgi:hypothetical protein